MVTLDYYEDVASSPHSTRGPRTALIKRMAHPNDPLHSGGF